MVVCSATAVDWLGDVSLGATVYSQQRPSDDGRGQKKGDSKGRKGGDGVGKF